MKIIITLFLSLFVLQSCFAQDTLAQNKLTKDTLALAKPVVIKDASYGGGGIDDLYYYVNNNFNYNNVKKEDIPEAFKKKPYFIFYVRFAVSEDGKTFEFSPKEIAAENSFYIEAVRVIASTSWNVATKDGVYKKQYMVLPIKASLSEI